VVNPITILITTTTEWHHETINASCFWHWVFDIFAHDGCQTQAKAFTEFFHHVILVF